MGEARRVREARAMGVAEPRRRRAVVASFRDLSSAPWTDEDEEHVATCPFIAWTDDKDAPPEPPERPHYPGCPYCDRSVVTNGDMLYARTLVFFRRNQADPATIRRWDREERRRRATAA